MNNFINLGIIFVIGFFLFLGSLIVFLFKNNKKFINFAIGLAFSIMMLLLLFEIIPEAFEELNESFNLLYSSLIMVGFSLLGVAFLKVLDLFIPDHDTDDHTKKKHLLHISLISTIAIVVHNIIEGMTIYTVFTSSLKSGLLLCLGVALHNIPLGISIATTFYNSNKSKIKTLLISASISFATFAGGLLIFLTNGLLNNNIIFGCLLSITTGMIIYIVFFELLHCVVSSDNKKATTVGVVAGILILLLSFLL